MLVYHDNTKYHFKSPQRVSPPLVCVVEQIMCVCVYVLVSVLTCTQDVIINSIAKPVKRCLAFQKFVKLKGSLPLSHFLSTTAWFLLLIYTEKFITLVGFVVSRCRVFIEVVINESH